MSHFVSLVWALTFFTQSAVHATTAQVEARSASGYTEAAPAAHGPHSPSHVSFQQRNFNTIQSIYNVNVYPNNLPFHVNGTAGVTPGLFNAKALGRISPVGNFTNFNQSVEYFFGLSGTQSAPSYQYFDKAELVSFSSDCPEVASSTVWFSTSVKPPGKAPTYVSSLKQVAFWRFDESGAVLYYDAYIPNLKAFTNTIGGLPRTDSVLPVMSQQQEIQYLLCPSIQSACTGPNQQYTDVADCVSVLNTKDYGDFGEAWGDYIVCRTIHVALALIDPVDHCPHVGPTGGSKCSDIIYNDVYFDDEKLFGSKNTFICPSKGH